jgi:hypothetical protein
MEEDDSDEEDDESDEEMRFASVHHYKLNKQRSAAPKKNFKNPRRYRL